MAERVNNFEANASSPPRVHFGISARGLLRADCTITSPPPFVQESGSLAPPALLVHGGAGHRAPSPGRSRSAARSGSGVRTGSRVDRPRRRSGRPRQRRSHASLEDSGLFNAGRGASRTSDGRVETDASVMDGATKAAGAVGAATWPANPVRAALLVASQALDGVPTRPPDQRTAPGTPAPPWGQVGTGTSACVPLVLRRRPGRQVGRGGPSHTNDDDREREQRTLRRVAPHQLTSTAARAL